jgi:uncharacterized cupin superfamily protein
LPEIVNLLDVELIPGEGGPPRFAGGASAMLGPTLGATMLGMTVYEVPPAAAKGPYHYELGREEWLLVLRGRPTVRTPEGERELEPGDVVCFPDGKTGAHGVANNTREAVRVALLSNKTNPSGCIYPDSGKIAVRGMWNAFRLEDAVDYWDGE